MEYFMKVVKALSERNRVRALMLLRDGELAVCQIIEMLGLAPSTVSKHLSVLSEAGLVRSRKDGRWTYYSLPAGGVEPYVAKAIQWVKHSLHRDDQVVEDAQRLEKVRNMSKEDLCVHYKKPARA